MYLGERGEGETTLGQRLLTPYLSKHQIHMCFCDGGTGHNNEAQLKVGKLIVTNGKEGESTEGYIVPRDSTSYQHDSREGREYWTNKGEEVAINNIPSHGWKSASGKPKKKTQELHEVVDRANTDLGGGANDALRQRRGDYK